mmetsp:Transcript_19885/g.37421  ORF Transcript_19885/g.37421 Transcript_19885/m.37421 type:complete len:270 (+) Transcript_19885:346-1155(+)
MRHLVRLAHSKSPHPRPVTSVFTQFRRIAQIVPADFRAAPSSRAVRRGQQYGGSDQGGGAEVLPPSSEGRTLEGRHVRLGKRTGGIASDDAGGEFGVVAAGKGIWMGDGEGGGVMGETAPKVRRRGGGSSVGVALADGDGVDDRFVRHDGGRGQRRRRQRQEDAARSTTEAARKRRRRPPPRRRARSSGARPPPSPLPPPPRADVSRRRGNVKTRRARTTRGGRRGGGGGRGSRATAGPSCDSAHGYLRRCCWYFRPMLLLLLLLLRVR